MTDDFIDQTFGDLYYPGSKRKRREPEVEAPKKDAAWDAHPRPTTLPNGKEIDLFTIGALAEALGRPVITLKLWMKEGHLPTSPYRLPTKVDKNGKERQGRRLYSRSMIESAISVFTKFNVLHVKRIDWVKYRKVTDEIAEAWNKSLAEETANN
jgi:hypothetical protein